MMYLFTYPKIEVLLAEDVRISQEIFRHEWKLAEYVKTVCDNMDYEEGSALFR